MVDIKNEIDTIKASKIKMVMLSLNVNVLHNNMAYCNLYIQENDMETATKEHQSEVNHTYLRLYKTKP